MNIQNTQESHHHSLTLIFFHVHVLFPENLIDYIFPLITKKNRRLSALLQGLNHRSFSSIPSPLTLLQYPPNAATSYLAAPIITLEDFTRVLREIIAEKVKREEVLLIFISPILLVSL
mmetsp:Transcript_18780/g.29849  ORF Transcript_18780/g.29849 Transcript_18780/m.29849 type:complete len:118 (-) Transcript_18780:169-522(-)